MEPIKINTKDRPEPKKVTVFEIDDVEYKIVDPVPASYAIKLMRLVNSGLDELAAITACIDELMGPEALDALAECDAVSEEEMNAIWDYLRTQVLGAINGVTGKSKSGRKR